MARGRRYQSIQDYDRHLRKGVGTGTMDSYQPWFRVQDVPGNCGRSSKPFGVKTCRQHHLLSDIEKNCFLYFEYQQGVVDLREQFPLLPLSSSVELAESLAIRHPKVKGSDCPWIMTTDLLLTLAPSSTYTHVAISCKPAEKLRGKSVLQKLELERQWWHSLGVPWFLVTDVQIPRIQTENLIWLSKDLRDTDSLWTDKESVRSRLELVAHTLHFGRQSLSELYEVLQVELSISAEDAAQLAHAAIWHQVISVDLNYDLRKEMVIDIHKLSLNITGTNDVRCA